MAYCTLAQFVPNHIRQKTFDDLMDDNDDSTPDAVYSEISILVDGIIDGHLQEGYPTLTFPVSPVPPILTLCAAWMAKYIMYSRANMVDSLTEKNWLLVTGEGGFLEMLKNGTLSLGTVPPVDTTLGIVIANKTAEDMTFGFENLEDFPMIGATSMNKSLTRRP